jgi:LysR family transcriptional regulator, benzoate and cis,cis-muconate-responsive activator of ben and cat genes
MRRPKLKLDNLIAILTLAEKRDFNEAARELGLTTSALRKQVEAVENTVGSRLFRRTRDGLALTEDGEVLHPATLKAIEYVLLAEEKIRTYQFLKSHHIHIGHSTYLSPKLIALVNQLSVEDIPNVHITHRSGGTSEVIQQVLQGTLHAGIGLLPIFHPDLLVRPIYEEPLLVCIPSDHKLATRHVIQPEDVEGEPIIAVGRQSLPALHGELEDHFVGFGIDLSVTTDVLSPAEALACVAQRIGICFLSTTSAVTRPGVVVRPVSTRLLTRKSGIFVREDNRAPLIQKLVDEVIRKAATLRPQSK